MNTESKTENLMDGIVNELNRNRELLKMYEEIGPAGMFGDHFIKQAIQKGEQAIREGDVIKMLTAYSALKDTQ